MESLMDLRTFWENFESIAEAPNGIAKLRSLILDLAVRGKLVPQNPEDEPASKLLTRIKESDISKVFRKKNALTLSELPFELPESWELVCLEHITREIHYGLTASANFSNSQVRFLRITDIQNNSVNWLSVPGCNIDLEKAKKYKLSNGDIVIARTGGTVGKSYLVESLQEDDVAVFASYLIRVVPSQHIFSRYLKLALESSIYWVQLSNSTTGTGQPNVNATSLKGFVLPLPPLAEQKRIVEKVDELMGLCDRLQAAQEARDTLRKTLRKSAIDALMNAETDEDLQKSWSIVRDHWQALTQKPEDVADLRRSILQLAVRGKLVTQDLTDETASELIEKVRLEKQALLELGSIRKETSLLPIKQEEKCFYVPINWEWIRGQDISTLVTSGSRGWAKYYSSSGAIFLRIGNLDYGTIELDLESLQFVQPPEGAEGARTKITCGDILISITGDTGMVGFVRSDLPEAYINQHIALLRPSRFICAEYLARFLTSDFALKQLKGAQRGIKNSLGLEDIRNLVITLPPLAEQKRIVAKVDELMQMCDKLEESLRQSQQHLEALTASAITHLAL